MTKMYTLEIWPKTPEGLPTPKEPVYAYFTNKPKFDAALSEVLNAGYSVSYPKAKSTNPSPLDCVRQMQDRYDFVGAAV